MTHSPKLSLIVCSRYSDITQILKDNIQATIGEDYELVVIDNSSNKYSIFSAYNEGVKRATGGILCFMHEDIMYETEDWGRNVIRHFEKSDTGLIGVFGGHYLPDLVCHIGDSQLLSANFCYQFSNGGKQYNYTREHFDENGEVEVVAVDGLWFAIPQSLFRKISFDEDYGGFHYYDMDICMQVWANGYKCKVVDDVVMEHNSGGTINDDFVRSSYRFYKKWKSQLPLMKGLVFDDEILRFSKELCQYKRYCRELEWENKKLKSRENKDKGIIGFIRELRQKIVKKIELC